MLSAVGIYFPGSPARFPRGEGEKADCLKMHFARGKAYCLFDVLPRNTLNLKHNGRAWLPGYFLGRATVSLIKSVTGMYYMRGA